MEENKPMWEEKFEQLKSQEPMAEKIKEMAENEKVLKEKDLQKVNKKIEKANKDLKEALEQREFLQFEISLLEEGEEEQLTKQIELGKVAGKIKRLIKKIQVLKDDKKLIEEIGDSEQLKEYKNYEKNKNKIEKVIEYRNKLIERLKGINELESTTRNYSKVIESNENYLNRKKIELEQKRKELSEVDVTLTDSEQRIADLNKEITTLEKDTTYVEKYIDSLKPEQEAYNSVEEAKSQKEIFEKEIDKYNYIAENLLLGKSINEIKLEFQGQEQIESEEELKPIEYIDPVQRLKTPEDIETAPELKPVEELNSVPELEPPKDLDSVLERKPVEDIESIPESKPIVIDLYPAQNREQASEVNPVTNFDLSSATGLEVIPELKPAQRYWEVAQSPEEAHSKIGFIQRIANIHGKFREFSRNLVQKIKNIGRKSNKGNVAETIIGLEPQDKNNLIKNISETFDEVIAEKTNSVGKNLQPTAKLPNIEVSEEVKENLNHVSEKAQEENGRPIQEAKTR